MADLRQTAVLLSGVKARSSRRLRPLACPAWPLLHCCSRPPTLLLALQLALQQPIPPPLSSSADSSARQQLPARPTAAMLMRALIPPQRRYAGFYCCYHCCQLSYSLCCDRSCHANWPPVSPAPVSAPTPTRFFKLRRLFLPRDPFTAATASPINFPGSSTHVGLAHQP